ncbi:hypothetical protein [Plesiomonas sp. ZOR0011]|uniref:hypothetical protein n=1 Tax=Plesiomonas sp. ZOR0011 TaxID=1339230 RepID=UPI000A4779AE|nr:hypothetical protein [Plesiomonas sp. ZOR0011]
MKKALLVVLALFSVNVFAADKPIVDVSDMGVAEINEVVKKMDSADFMKLYRYYNQAVLDDWDNGAKGEDKVSPVACKIQLDLSMAGKRYDKVSQSEIKKIDRENKKSVMKLCMKNF